MKSTVGSLSNAAGVLKSRAYVRPSGLVGSSTEAVVPPRSQRLGAAEHDDLFLLL